MEYPVQTIRKVFSMALQVCITECTFLSTQLSSTWVELIINSLIYYILKNLRFVMSNYTSELLLRHSFKMKEKYSSLHCQGQNKEEFNFNIMIMVKLITYFIAAHIQQIEIDQILENEIYKLIIRNLLGVSVQSCTYKLLLKKYKNKKESKKQRDSLNASKENITSTHNLNVRKKESSINFARRNGKKQTSLFSNASRVNQEHNRIDEIKHLIKQSLYVKPIPKRPNQKYNIHQLQLKQQGQIQQLRPGNKSEYQEPIHHSKHSKFTIQSNQLSNAFQLHNDLKLKDIKSFSIHCTPAKQIAPTYLKIYQIEKSEQPQMDQKIQEVQPQKQVKQNKNWNSIVSDMKEEVYGRKINYPSQNQQVLSQNKLQVKSNQFLISDASISEANFIKQSVQNSDISKFRKLDILNCPNLEFQDKKSFYGSSEIENLPKLMHQGKGMKSVVNMKSAKFQKSSVTISKQNLFSMNLPPI